MDIDQIVICNTPVAQLRAEPSERAELETQMLYGERAVVKDIGLDDWVFVETEADQYAAWVDVKHLKADDGMVRTHFVSEPTISLIANSQKIILPYGALLTDSEYQQLRDLSGLESDRQAGLECEAMKFLNAPYLWGGKTVFGIDCSAFIQLIAQSKGIQLPRNASKQYEMLQSVDFYEKAPDDVAFFQNDKGRIVHVGLILEDDRIIHASGRVRIDTITEEGIVRSDDGRLTHRLAGLGRLK